MEEPFITAEEAGSVLGITRGALAAMRYKGTGPKFYKPNKRTVYYRRSDIHAWIEASVRTSTADHAHA
jgi:predicted DNA-binding transcriptional regulator AlpA